MKVHKRYTPENRAMSEISNHCHNLLSNLYIFVIQTVREISVIILTDDSLCYKEPKSPYNVFLL